MRQALKFWHPVLRSKELGEKPVKVQVCNQEIVLFRTRDGQIGALFDRCPHRHMPLSSGCVHGNHIVCPYHGYRFDIGGQGERPGMPGKNIQVADFDVKEASNVIWIKHKHSDQPLPDLNFPGYYPLGVLDYRIKAPFQILLDNMTELEHTTTVHKFFGFDIENIRDVETSVETLEDRIRIFYSGPYRKLPMFLKWTMGIRSSDLFIQHAETRFQPVHTAYELSWSDPMPNGHSRRLKLKFVIFYNPTTVDESSMFAFAYWNRPASLIPGFNGLVQWVLGKVIDFELRSDKAVMEKLPPGSTVLAGNALSRFDTPLIETRKRIDKFYYGQSESAPETL
jgi:phenylpropionate dioxygenase-like ring-hydroxylating dioxygenase large terminal subunit